MTNLLDLRWRYAQYLSMKSASLDFAKNFPFGCLYGSEIVSLLPLLVLWVDNNFVFSFNMGAV